MDFMKEPLEERPSGGTDDEKRAFIDNLASAHASVSSTAARRAAKED